MLALHWIFAVLVAVSAARVLPPHYDVVWDSPTAVRNGSSSSMPVGGGDMGLNVWVENGTVLFYVAKDGCFDENNSMLKLGRVRLMLEPNPFALEPQQHFEQRLSLEDGYVQIKGGYDAIVTLWVDVYTSVVHAHVSMSTPATLRAAFESWRYEDHEMTAPEQAQSSWNGIADPLAVTHKDHISFLNEESVLAYHRNVNTRLFDATLAQQELSAYKNELYDPTEKNTFGMLMYGPGLKAANINDGHYINSSFRAWNLQSTSKQNSFDLTLVSYQNQTSTYQDWHQQLMAIKTADQQSTATSQQSKTLQWWHSFWERSHILINTEHGEDDEGFIVGRNYQLFRYMLGCNAMSTWPSRFNGGLFTFDPFFVNANYPFSPDFRLWGGGTYTAQNQRLMYWPLLKTGDLDIMIPQFEFYRRIVPSGLLRGRVYRDIDHTMFTEQIDNSGLPQIYNFNSDEYIFDTKRPLSFNPGQQFDAWIIWLGDTVLEFAMMVLDAKQYFGLDATPYMPFIEHSIIWYDVLYTQLQQTRDVYGRTGVNGNESLVIFPGTGCETYKGAYNPATTVSGLRAIIQKMLQVDPPYSVGNKTYYRDLIQHIPATPLRVQQGRVCIAPAEAYARIQNVEIPQLYPVFPWHEFGVGLPNLTYAINTYLYDTETQAFHSAEGWKQDAIWLADMGLTEMAQNVTSLKLQDANMNRFPTFWGPGFDWTPQMDTGGTGMIALQEMLLQTYNNESKMIRLIPAWPKNWTADFKLRAPFNTIVQGRVEQGHLVNLRVEPPERKKDVVIGS